ncbi:MAG: hypothetical protein LBE06_03110 [Azoarcus sp.]|jgi:hypothetical protein|nr:hypothetical protein [Azoarcus sp.]
MRTPSLHIALVLFSFIACAPAAAAAENPANNEYIWIYAGEEDTESPEQPPIPQPPLPPRNH